jgi:hypothetical protein
MNRAAAKCLPEFTGGSNVVDAVVPSLRLKLGPVATAAGTPK